MAKTEWARPETIKGEETRTITGLRRLTDIHTRLNVIYELIHQQLKSRSPLAALKGP